MLAGTGEARWVNRRLVRNLLMTLLKALVNPTRLPEASMAVLGRFLRNAAAR